MWKFTRLNGCLDQIELGFVEREATPQLLMKLGVQLYLTGLSLSNTVSILEIFGISRARSTIHNWVHKAELQPESGRTPDHVAVDETVIRLNDERYWLYAAVDPEPNELLQTKLEPTRNNALANDFFAELRQKHHVDDPTFLVDGATPLHEACRRHGLDFRYERHGNRNVVERVFREVKPVPPRSRTVSATPIQQLPTSGCDHSPSHGTSLSEHYRVNVAQVFSLRASLCVILGIHSEHARQSQGGIRRACP